MKYEYPSIGHSTRVLLYLFLSWVVSIPLGIFFGELTYGSLKRGGSAAWAVKIAEFSHMTGLAIILAPLAVLGFVWMLIGPFVLAIGVVVWMIIAAAFGCRPELPPQAGQQSVNVNDQNKTTDED